MDSSLQRPAPHPMSHAEQAYRVARHAIRVHSAIQNEHELACLIDLALQREPRVVVEVGTALGGGFYALAQAATDNAKLYSVDMGAFGGGVYAPPALLQQYAKPEQTVIAIHGNSQSEKTRDTLQYWLDGDAIDLLFIDADHHYESVKRDHELYAPLVRPGGLVAFHDIQRDSGHQAGCEVNLFWQDLKPSLFKVWEFTQDTQFGIGVYQQPLTALKAPEGRQAEPPEPQEESPLVEVRASDWTAMPTEVAEERARVGSRLARLERKYR